MSVQPNLSSSKGRKACPLQEPVDLTRRVRLRRVANLFGFGGSHCWLSSATSRLQSISWAALLFEVLISGAAVRSVSVNDAWLHRSSNGELVEAANLSKLDFIAWEGPFARVLKVEGPSLVLQMGVVISACPLSVLDLSGGCCRQHHPFSLKHPTPFHALPRMFTNWVQRGSCDAPVRHAGETRWFDGWSTLLRVVDDYRTYPEHRELFLCLSARSSSFYHALGQVALRLLPALDYLRRSAHTRILATSSLMTSLLKAFGIPTRRLILWRAGVNEPGKLFFRARRVLIPPPLDELQSRAYRPRWARPLLLYMRDLILGQAARASSDTSRGVQMILVVQRAARWPDGRSKRGRALLNHEAVVGVLRELFVRGDYRQVVTFPPEPRPLIEQARQWNSAGFVLAPHGAGLTNLIFLPRHGTAGVLELRAAGHKGAVYHQLAASAAVRHEECMFHPGDVANGRQLLLDGPDANVILPVPFILHCMKGKYHSTASSTDAESEAIFSTGVWHRVDVLLRKLSSRTSAYTPSTMFASQAMVQCLRLCASGPRCGQRPQAVACIDAALSNNQANISVPGLP